MGKGLEQTLHKRYQNGQKHTKSSSTSLIIRETKIKPPQYTIQPLEQLKIKRQKIPHMVTLSNYSARILLVWLTVQLLGKAELCIYYLATPLQGIHPTEVYTHVLLKTHKRLFTTVPFITAKTWKQPNTHQSRIGKTHNHTTEYYTAMKINNATQDSMDESSKHKIEREKPDFFKVNTIWFQLYKI